jgi:hypothetical protein
MRFLRHSLGVTRRPISNETETFGLRTALEANHSHPSGAGVRSPWNCTSTPWRDAWLGTGYVFMALYLVEGRDNFTLTLPYECVSLSQRHGAS